MKAGTLVTIAIALGALACASDARAQTAGFAVDRFDPSERGSDWFANESLDLRGSLRPALGLIFDWAYQPVVLYERGNIRGQAQGNVLTDQIFVHAGGALVFADRFRVAANLPLAIYQHGDDIEPIALGARNQNGGSGVGDLRLSGDARIFGTYGDPLTVAVGVQVYLPTGSRAALTSDGTVRVAPRLLLAGEVEDWFVYAAKGGFAYRPFEGTFEGSALGSEFTFSGAVGVKVNDRFVFGPEIYGSTVVLGGDGAFRTRNTPLEMLFGAHVTLADHWQAGTAIGPGLTRGDGSPKMRMIVSLEFAPDICVDKDGDGICEGQDACPEADGVRTDDPKTNGCPTDRDKDGILDKDDMCPDERGSRTLDPKSVGCPDRDQDSVADKDDACPDVRGSASTDPKVNGCPQVDTPVIDPLPKPGDAGAD